MKEETKKRSGYKPAQIKRVLISIDYDPSAQKVAETGYSLAKSLNAEVILLHIVSEINYYSPLEFSPVMGYTGLNTADYPNLIDIEKVKEAARQFLDKSKQHLGGENIEILVEEGETANAIIQTAEKKKVDIIILGSHGRTGLEKMLLGNVAEKVISRSLKPVLVIPSRKSKKKE